MLAGGKKILLEEMPGNKKQDPKMKCIKEKSLKMQWAKNMLRK